MNRRGDFKTNCGGSDSLIKGCPKNEVDIEAGGEDGSPLNIDGIYESALDLIDSALLTIEREEQKGEALNRLDLST